MASTGNEYLWGFLRYARANPFNSLNSVHFDELDDMMKGFSQVNHTQNGGGTETDPADYGAGIDIPGKTTVNTDTNGIGFQIPTTALTDQAYYPEMHLFTTVPA